MKTISNALETTLILQLNNAIYGVVKNENGTITIFGENGLPNKNAGSIISSLGGVEATLLKCYVSVETFGEIIAKREAANDIVRKRQAEIRSRIQSDGKRLDVGSMKFVVVDGHYFKYRYPSGWSPTTEEAYRKAKESADDKNSAIEASYNSLLQASNGIIETTYNNLAIVMRWLNIQDNPQSAMPQMSIGYVVNQYDCDGQKAITVTLDEPLAESGETKFVHGAPAKHLIKYMRVR